MQYSQFCLSRALVPVQPSFVAAGKRLNERETCASVANRAPRCRPAASGYGDDLPARPQCLPRRTARGRRLISATAHNGCRLQSFAPPLSGQGPELGGQWPGYAVQCRLRCPSDNCTRFRTRSSFRVWTILTALPRLSGRGHPSHRARPDKMGINPLAVASVGTRFRRRRRLRPDQRGPPSFLLR